MEILSEMKGNLTSDNTVRDQEVPEGGSPRGGDESAGEQRSTQDRDLPVAEAFEKRSVEQPQRHAQRWVQVEDQRGVEGGHVELPELVFEDETEARQHRHDEHLDESTMTER